MTAIVQNAVIYTATATHDWEMVVYVGEGESITIRVEEYKVGKKRWINTNATCPCMRRIASYWNKRHKDDIKEGVMPKIKGYSKMIRNNLIKEMLKIDWGNKVVGDDSESEYETDVESDDDDAGSDAGAE
jgi:hypothetical protein